MTTDTRAPAQAARAGDPGRAPAAPHSTTSQQPGAASEPAAPIGQGPRNTEPSSRARSGPGATSLDPRKCNARSKRTGLPCGQWKGHRTDHPGSGHCFLHGGRSPIGKKHAARERAAKTLADLAIPAQGDPIEVLQAVVERSFGLALGAQELLAAATTTDDQRAHLELYIRTLRDASLVAKRAAEAINLDELVKIREREADLFELALTRTIERFGIPAKRRPEFLNMLREELVAVAPSGAGLS